MTRIPLIVKPTTGLRLRAGKWYAHYREDGTRREIALESSDLSGAIVCRDALYADLVLRGAVTGNGRGRPRNPDEWQHVYHCRESWAVRVNGRHIGTFHSPEEARRARDAYLSPT